MITISGCICYINSELGLVNLIKFNHNNRMITLSVITLSGFHCTLKINDYYRSSKIIIKAQAAWTDN